MPAPYFVTLRRFRPAERLPPVTTPWRFADITENPSGPTEDGEEVIATIDLSTLPGGLDEDPADPATRDFSTDDAQYPAAWYRVIFRDAAGASGPTEWVAASGAGIFLPPAASVIRDRSLYIAGLFPVDGTAESETRLRELVKDATVLVESLTCRTLDATLAEDQRLGRLALAAVTMKAERMAKGRASAKGRRGQVGQLNLKSFSAGPYSETYFTPEDIAKLKRLDVDPELHEILWALATEECRQKWLELWGEAPARPFAAVMAFDYGYGRARRRY